MNSISRAVTSRFNDISHKRQRLVGENAKDSEIINPSWSSPSTSDFNYYEPPTLIIPEENCQEACLTPILDKSSEKPRNSAEKSPNKNISKKMTSVVRKLSPFGSNISLSKEAQTKESEEIELDSDKKQKKFKETGSCSLFVYYITVLITITPNYINIYNMIVYFYSKLYIYLFQRCKMDKIKKSFKSKDRQQLIDSDEE